MNNYTPIGSLVMERVYSAIDGVLDDFNMEHNETVAQLIVNAICKGDVDICIKTTDQLEETTDE